MVILSIRVAPPGQLARRRRGLSRPFPSSRRAAKLNRLCPLLEFPLPTPDIGVIEGFFGRPWPWAERRACAEFLAGEGYHFYIYAPKGDACLRRHWQRDWPGDQWRELLRLRQQCADQGIAFGLGLSPLELYRESPAPARAALTQKIQRLNTLAPDILCLLFDDMRGDLPELAARQIDLAHCAAEVSSARRLILCPTYYSTDPVLEKVFGARPEGYWEELGSGLRPSIDLFWTGPRVCSDQYPADHLAEVTRLLGRKPFLWDNYPVNDSTQRAPRLLLRAFGADRAQLAPLLAGHAVNPMNQPRLSRIPLATLPRAYREGNAYDPKQALASACLAQCPAAMATRLQEDLALLQDSGLEALDTRQREALRARYREFDHPAARELLDWLDGAYAFDPACLTD